jgi:multiple sugar transport system permease protein
MTAAPAAPRIAPRTTASFTPAKALGWFVLLIFILTSSFPMVWMLFASITPTQEFFSHPERLMPDQPTMINFLRVVGLTTFEEAQAAGGSGVAINFGRYLLNTGIMMFGMVSGQVVFSTLAGYAFSRLRFAGRNIVFYSFLGVMMVPGIVTFIPNYITIWQLGWLNTYHGLIAPYFFFTPILIFFMRQYFLSISTEIEDAARVDGASIPRIFWRVVLPMATPAISTVTIFACLLAWNEYLWPLLAARGENTRVINVALSIFQQQSPAAVPDFTGLMAASTIAILPMILLLVVFGRRVIDALGGFSGIK